MPGGTQLFIGTPHTFQSIYAEHATEEGHESRSPYLASFDRLVLPIYDEEGESRWPERFSNGHIEGILERTGPAAFQSQMLLRPNAGHQIRLDPDKLRLYDSDLVFSSSNGGHLLLLDGKRLVSGISFWDPAYGRDVRADSSVVALVYLDEDGHYWLHAVRYLRVNDGVDAKEDAASQQCRSVAQFLKESRQGHIIIENNGIGQFLPSTPRRVLQEERFSASVVSIASAGRKSDRILNALDPIMAAGRLHVHRSVWDTPFIQEMREWSPVSHSRDDGLDALSSCLRHLPQRPPLARRRPYHFRRKTHPTAMDEDVYGEHQLCTLESRDGAASTRSGKPINADRLQLVVAIPAPRDRGIIRPFPSSYRNGNLSLTGAKLGTTWLPDTERSFWGRTRRIAERPEADGLGPSPR
ncbi:hypothetical protein SAMN07250955_105224 [Arboricoccus pini]|uniref:Terminase-like family protein n=1 Tax=Arboricoccus pini TaxID=1963835 RepID=A0A212R4R0_9PROT|nr:hypothetical protein SAMN07250955_105224 [Arboricoccus pini]